MMGHISNILHQDGSEIVEYDRRSYLKVENQERICGVCLKVYDNFKAVEGDMKDMLDVVLPKIDLTAVREFVMCTHCTEMLTECSGFKTTCLNSYNYIVSFANKKDDVKLNLRDVYLIKNDIDAKDQVICGFCMGPIRNCSAISLDVEEGEVMLKKMIEQCLPELDLSVIEKPVICAPCHGSLENCFDFVTNCLFVEEKIKKYCETQDINIRGQVELNHLLQFTARDVTTNEVSSNPNDMIKEEKQFCEEEGNADEKIINNGGDIFKLEQVFCSDSENAVEESKVFDGIKTQETFCGKKETYFKEENLCKIESDECLESEELEDIDMKIDEPDFVRFEDDLILPQSEVTNANRWTMIKTNSELLYKCNSCSYHARSRTSILRHLLVHKSPSKITMYTCDTCSYQSRYKSDLKKHLWVHMDSSKVTMYKCDSCSYQSRYKGVLKDHLLVHKSASELRVFSCDTCSYQSKYKCALKKHLLVHMDSSEVTMYKCDSCSYQSRYKGNLINHSITHKNPSEVTAFTCDICSYQSKYKGGLKSHLLRHKNPSEVTAFTCDFCSYQSKYKGDLKRHLLAHEK